MFPFPSCDKPEEGGEGSHLHLHSVAWVNLIRTRCVPHAKNAVLSTCGLCLPHPQRTVRHLILLTASLLFHQIPTSATIFRNSLLWQTALLITTATRLVQARPPPEAGRQTSPQCTVQSLRAQSPKFLKVPFRQHWKCWGSTEKLPFPHIRLSGLQQPCYKELVWPTLPDTQQCIDHTRQNLSCTPRTTPAHQYSKPTSISTPKHTSPGVTFLSVQFAAPGIRKAPGQHRRVVSQKRIGNGRWNRTSARVCLQTQPKQLSVNTAT